jgi:hypothetical protein
MMFWPAGKSLKFGIPVTHRAAGIFTVVPSVVNTLEGLKLC